MTRRTLAKEQRRAAGAALLSLALVASLAAASPVGAQEPEPDDPCFVPPGETIPQKVPAPVCGTTVIDASGHMGITSISLRR